MKKILFINIFYSPSSYGGATIVVEQVSRNLCKIPGYVPFIISCQSRADLEHYTVQRVESQGITNFVINLPPGLSFTDRYDNPKFAEVVSRIVEFTKPDCVNVHCVQELGASFFDHIVERNIPLILSIHDFWWVCERQFMITTADQFCGQTRIEESACSACAAIPKQSQLRRQYLKKQADKAAVITYPSKYAKFIHDSSGFDKAKGIVWNNGIVMPDESFFKLQSKRRSKDDTITFGFLGGPSHMKGWPLIKDAFKKVNPKHKFNVKVVDGAIWGNWWSGNMFAELPGQWSIYPRFEQTQIDEYYSNIDVLLFMSQWKETFGLTIREALARGISVIQTRSGGTEEHPAFNEDLAIEIGASSNELANILNETLENGIANTEAIEFPTFFDQAVELVRIIDKVCTANADVPIVSKELS